MCSEVKKERGKEEERRKKKGRKEKKGGRLCFLQFLLCWAGTHRTSELMHLCAWERCAKVDNPASLGQQQEGDEWLTAWQKFVLSVLFCCFRINSQHKK